MPGATEAFAAADFETSAFETAALAASGSGAFCVGSGELLLWTGPTTFSTAGEPTAFGPRLERRMVPRDAFLFAAILKYLNVRLFA
jgi:hypothetical protein